MTVIAVFTQPPTDPDTWPEFDSHDGTHTIRAMRIEGFFGVQLADGVHVCDNGFLTWENGELGVIELQPFKDEYTGAEHL